MINIKKLFYFSLTILILIIICCIGFQYHNTYKKKENYKQKIIEELKSGLLFIEEVFNKDLELVKKEIDAHFQSFLEEDVDLNEEQLLRLKVLVNDSFMRLQPPSEYLRSEYWQSSKQSGILSQFLVHKLKQLNRAYSERDKLVATEKIVQKFGFNSASIHTMFSKEISKRELEIIHRKYQKFFLEYSTIAKGTGFQYYNAIEILEDKFQNLCY
ncbi:hypothetical protein MHTCC0001_06410 [Flavobacteriaceae bacterium MHTCC 0001]